MSPVRRITIAFLLVAPALAGCVTPPDVTINPESTPELAFTPVRLVDDVRSGGEPVIQITPTGTILVAAHPGWTHTRSPPSENLATPGEAQSYIWRSEDNGETWERSGALPAGPKGPWVGVSDPDFAIDADGTIYFTDLGPLTHTAVMVSNDDGKTWEWGNPVMPGPVDRQWLAAYGSDAYFIANYFQGGERVLKSSDKGQTWNQVGTASCSGDIWADPLDGTLYIGCGNGIDVSTDGGVTWEQRTVPGTDQNRRTMAEPVTDAAGNVYTTWTDADQIFVAGSSDQGETWSTPTQVSSAHADTLAATNLWPWLVAGDDGRIAVVWFADLSGAEPETTEGDWYVYQATVTEAMTDAPAVYVARATDVAIHSGAMCQRGTVCQADQQQTGDRRMGDFFEAAVDANGFVHTVFSTTTISPDSISHAGYIQQISGPKLVG